MVTERVEVDLEELYDETPEVEVLDDATIEQTISEEQATNDSKEAEEDTDSQDASRYDAFKEAAESLSQEPQPEVITKADFTNTISQLTQSFRDEIAALRNAGMQVSASEPPSADELALERLLAEGENPATPEEVAATRARLSQHKQAIEKEQNEQSIPDRLKAIEEGIDAIKKGANAPAGVKQWTDAERTHLTNAVMYLSAAAGLNIDLSNATQVSAVMSGIAPGEDVPTAIQQMQGNIAQIKANFNNESETNTSDATGTVVANVPSMGGAVTTSDARVFNSEEDIKLAIANDEIDLADYNKYLAQITN